MYRKVFPHSLIFLSQVLFPTLKKLHLCTFQNLAMYRKVFPHSLIFLSFRSSTSPCPEDSFLQSRSAKFQTDLITTTSRKRTQWGQPPPRRVFNQNTKPQNNGSHCTSRSTLFHTGKRKRQSKLAVHAACTVLCWSSCTCPVLNTAAESHRFHKNKLSFSLVNSEWMNSPTSPKNHSK